MKRLLAGAVGLLAGAALFLFVDLAISPLVIPLPDQVELVPADARPYRRLDRGWYQLKPSFRGRDFWGSAVYDVATDEHGFRVDDQRPAKPGSGRVIFLGDSFTYGVNGPWAQTFVGMYDLDSTVRILNTAVPSYSPTAYLHAYRAALRGQALAPSHDVVLMLDPSDVGDEATVWRDGDDHPFDRRVLGDDAAAVARGRAVAAQSWRGRLRFTRAAYETVRYSILRIPNAAVFDQYRSAFTWADWAMLDQIPAARSGYAPDGVARALQRVREKIRAIAALAQQSGGRLFVAVYPWPAQLQHPSHFDWPGFVRDACRDVCAGVVDTFPAFRQRQTADADWYTALYVFNDVHFNTEGNRLVYEQLKAALPPR